MTNPFTSFAFSATGAPETRTMPARLLDVVNVKDFGATGDGVTDDWDAIMSALSWNCITVEIAEHLYSPAVRIASLAWATGTVTVTVVVPHGLTTGDQVLHLNSFSTGNSSFDGRFTVAVLDSTRFTYPLAENPGPPATPCGCFLPGITGATWSANVVTVNFAAPHRMISGLTVTVSGFSDGMDGSRVITVTSPTQLTFPFTGSGSPTVNPFGWVGHGNKIVVTEWPGIPAFFPGSSVFSYYSSDYYPVCHAAYFAAQLQDVTGTTLTFNGSFFWHDMQVGDRMRLWVRSVGKIYFPPGEYYISKQIKLPLMGAIGIIFGAPGSSIIRGSFPNYLMTHPLFGGGPIRIENLAFVNDDAAGGGLQAVCSSMRISGCTFTAGDVGLSLAQEDSRNAVAFGAEITGCMFFPGSDASVGIADSSNNSEISGNYFHGLPTGIRSQNFYHNTDGNSFVDCGIAILGGMTPQGVLSFTVTGTFRGNVFTNCGTAIYCANLSQYSFEGNYIVGGPDSNYGLHVDELGNALVKGLYATGEFSTTAIQPQSTSTRPHIANHVVFRSVGAENSGSGDVWGIGGINGTLSMDNCDVLPLFLYGGLNGRAVDGLSYDSGTGIVTLTTDSRHWLSSDFVMVTGVKVSGSTDNRYNGIHTPLGTSFDEGSSTVTYHVGAAPGTADAGTGAAASGAGGGKQTPIKAIDWDSGIVTVETLGPHGIPKYSPVQVHAIIGGNESNGYTGTFQATATDLTHFTYAVASDPGTVDSPTLSPSVPSFQVSPSTLCIPTICLNGLYRFSVEGISTGNITDGQKLGGGTAAIGDIVEGGGSQHISVAWTQNGWMRCG